jgi:nitroreductase
MIDAQTLLDTFHFRHACKSFDPGRKIDAADFDLILETGRLSPASFGYEPWRFLVIQNPDLREKLKAVTWGAQTHLPTASHFLVILSRRAADMRFDSPWLDQLMRTGMGFDDTRVAQRVARFKTFQEQDFHLLDDDRYLFEWSCRQCYIALGNMMTAAALRGIDSCAIEGYDQALAEAVLNDAGLTENGRFGIAVMCAFGYRIKPQTPKTRQPLTDIVRWA